MSPSWPRLHFVHQFNVFLLQGTPELDAGFQVGSHPSGSLALLPTLFLTRSRMGPVFPSQISPGRSAFSSTSTSRDAVGAGAGPGRAERPRAAATREGRGERRPCVPQPVTWAAAPGPGPPEAEAAAAAAMAAAAAAALGGLGLLRARLRLAAATAATSAALGRTGHRAPPLQGGAAALPSAGRSYGSQAKEEEELRVRYLDDEHKGKEGKTALHPLFWPGLGDPCGAGRGRP